MLCASPTIVDQVARNSRAKQIGHAGKHHERGRDDARASGCNKENKGAISRTWQDGDAEGVVTGSFGTGAGDDQNFGQDRSQSRTSPMMRRTGTWTPRQRAAVTLLTSATAATPRD